MKNGKPAAEVVPKPLVISWWFPLLSIPVGLLMGIILPSPFESNEAAKTWRQGWYEQHAWHNYYRCEFLKEHDKRVEAEQELKRFKAAYGK